MKKIALILALLMLALCCVGCGNDEKANETGGTAASQSATQSDEADMDLCAESEDGKHQYDEEVISEATCVENGLMLYTCVACDQSTTKEIPATGHEGIGASCEEPSICTICWEVAEEAWGHEWEGGICRNCGIDMSELPTVPATTAPAVTEPEETEAEEVEATEAATAQ